MKKLISNGNSNDSITNIKNSNNLRKSYDDSDTNLNKNYKAFQNQLRDISDDRKISISSKKVSKSNLNPHNDNKHNVM